MSVQVGDTFPSCTIKTMGENGPEDISTETLCSGKKSFYLLCPVRSHPVVA